MLRFLCCQLLLATWGSQALAQAPPAPRIASGISFAARLPVAAYAGRPYRMSMRARADTAGGSWASVSIFYLNSRRPKGSRLLGGADLHEQPAPLNRVRAAGWQTYTIIGKLPAQADTLLVLPNVRGNGCFAFDDFRLEVARPDHGWQTMALSNADFEAPAPADSSANRLPPGWRALSDGPVAGYRYRVAAEAGGNHYLLVRGTGIVPYGDNRRAGQYRPANGVRLYFETYGQGPPLLLLHGNGESISSFTSQIGALAQSYHVIAVDTRDHGKSAATKGKLTYDLFADDIRALLDTLRIPAAHVVGWSDGGNTGLSLALRSPSRVLSLTTMGANLYADTTAVEAKTLREVRQLYRLTSVLGLGSRKMRQAHRLTALLLHYPRLRPAELATIKVPVLVLAGEKDIIKVAHTRLIAASIPGARLVILPGLTHYAPQENPTLFNETVLNFLRGLPAR